MLKTIQLSKPQDKLVYLKEFDPNSTTWLVSELHTKFEIQRLILERQPYFEDMSVLRASELWKWIHRRARPDWKLISRDFFQCWLRDELKKKDGSFSRNADMVLLHFMDHLSSILTHPEGVERLQEWLSENPASIQRWGSWFELSVDIYSSLEKNKILPISWLAGSLQNILKISNYWNRSLIVDLNSQLSRNEADLFFQLSKDISISILEPFPEWRENYQFLLSGYDLLRNSKDNAPKSVPKSAFAQSNFKLHRCTGPLAEVKLCTEVVRKWIEEGYSSSQIAVVAPEIEEYWSLLEPYFLVEGIPVAKDRVTRLHGLPVFSKWLANLRLYANKVQFADLELSFYEQEESRFLRYEKFHALFSQLISSEDLERHEIVRKAFTAKYSLNENLSRDSFIGYALSFWPENANSNLIEIVLRDLLTSSFPQMQLQLSSWLFYVEQICAKQEIKIREGEKEGIQLLNLSSIDSFYFEKIFYLGLSESQLREKYQGLLKANEVAKIAQDLGFYLDHPEVSNKEFDLAWSHENSNVSVVYSFPESNFSGSKESASSFWLELANGNVDEFTVSEETRWSSIERSLLHKKLPVFENLHLDVRKNLSLSISGIEDYNLCPFVFAAKRIFRLKDEPTVDFEADSRSLGVIEHALLEALSKEPRRFDWEISEIENLLNLICKERKIQFFDANMWSSFRQKYSKRALKFLDFEKNWKNQFPASKIVAREQEIKFFVDPQTGCINTLEGVAFNGKIDRIESDGASELVIVDYKSSTSSLRSLKSWIEKDQLQLLFYSFALDSIKMEGFTSSEVVGAFYYDIKKRDRSKGYHLSTSKGLLFSMDFNEKRKTQSKIQPEEKEEYYKKLQQKISTALQLILRGEFQPKPKDKKSCLACEWRNLCRAPHLR